MSNYNYSLFISQYWLLRVKKLEQSRKDGVNYITSIFNKIRALHICLLLNYDIFEYNWESYSIYKNVWKTL